MPIYRGSEGDTAQIIADVLKSQEEHRKLREEAAAIFKKDLPLFLKMRMAADLIGRKEAEELYKIINR